MAGKERQQRPRRDGGGQGETAAGKERRWWARRDGGRQGETAAGKERQRQARRDGSGQGEMAVARSHFLAEEGQQCLKHMKMRYVVQAVV